MDLIVLHSIYYFLYPLLGRMAPFCYFSWSLLNFFLVNIFFHLMYFDASLIIILPYVNPLGWNSRTDSFLKLPSLRRRNDWSNLLNRIARFIFLITDLIILHSIYHFLYPLLGRMAPFCYFYCSTVIAKKERLKQSVE